MFPLISENSLNNSLFFLTKDDINNIPKSILLKKFHQFIRFWYVNNSLPDVLVKDPTIMPYFTPCNLQYDRSDSELDEIDGVITMQGYCLHCKK